jgi:hypothetical protein
MQTMNRLLSTILAIAALGAAATAQVTAGYAFTQNPAGTYVPITGGTQLAVATGTSGAASIDDVTFPTVTLPFPFTFDNNSYTAVNINSNGFLTFGATAPAGANYGALSATTAYAGAVASFSRDIQAGFCFAADRTLASNQLTNVSLVGGPLQVGDFLSGTGIAAGTTVTAIAGNVITMSTNATAAGVAVQTQSFGAGSEVRYETLGSSPNQVFVVQWKGFKRFGTGTTSQHMTLNFQVRLNETTNVIEAVYGDCSPGVTTTTTVIQVGLRGPNNTFATNVLNRLNVKGTSDWATSTAGTTNTSGEVFNNVAPANVIANGLTYTWTPQLIATNVSYGTGCYNVARDSFYQSFASTAAAAAALSNTSYTMTYTGTGYLVSAGGGTFVTPSGTATSLALTDDSEAMVALSAAMPYPGGSTSALAVCSNGFVSAATGNGTSFSPTAAALLAMPQCVWAVWKDNNPAIVGSGQVKFEEVAGIAYVTYDGVWDYLGASAAAANTYQFQFDVVTGNVVLVIGTLSPTGTQVIMPGHSRGGASFDPGSIDLATALPIVTQPDVYALALAAAPAPVLGNTVVYTTSNIPPAALITAQIMSLVQVNPGLPIPGAPGCLQLVDLSVSATNLLFGAPTATFSFTIPVNPGLIGLPLSNQSASLVPGANPLQVITSNGIKSTISNI